jgi:DNA-binding GntR family transcriptional regulator
MERIPKGVLKEIFPKKLRRKKRVNWTPKGISDQLKEKILSGKLKKGHKLTERDIAGKYNVSRTTIHLAFKELKKEGLLISNGRLGTFLK